LQKQTKKNPADQNNKIYLQRKDFSKVFLKLHKEFLSPFGKI